MAATAETDPLTRRIIGCAIEVYRELGPGLLESAYRECLCFELHLAGLEYRKEVPLPVTYKSVSLDCGYRLDIAVEDSVVVELKTVEQLLPIHEAQVLTYLKLSRIGKGLLMNFNSAVLKDGLRRFVL
jgi:GxxExxY protein